MNPNCFRLALIALVASWAWGPVHAQASGSSIAEVSAYGCPGQPVCVCGESADGWSDLTVNGQPVGLPIAASTAGALIRLPSGLAPGTASIASPASRSTLQIVDAQVTLDTSTLQIGQSATIQASVQGPANVRFANRGSGTIALSQAANSATVTGTSTGPFEISYAVEPAACPCEIPGSSADELIALEEQPDPSSNSHPLFVPRAVLITIAPDDPDPEAVARDLAAAFDLEVQGVESLGSLGLVVGVLATKSDGADIEAVSQTVAADPRVLSAQPNYLYQTMAVSSRVQEFSYPSRLIRSDRLDTRATGRGVRVGLIDSGVQADHPALAQAVVETISVAGTPYTADVHGTFIAGIIAARPGVVSSVRGVAPDAQIFAIKACNAAEPDSELAYCSSLAVTRGLDESIRRGIDVLNMSIGLSPRARYAKLVQDAVNTVADMGIFVVAAAGNDGQIDRPALPAAMGKVTAVTAVDEGPRLYWNASRGRFIDLAAPGVLILSTDTGGGARRRLGGTSYAAAFVTGAAALLLELDPQLSPRKLKRALERTAVDLGARGRDERFGSGLVDVCRAATQISKDAADCD